MVVTAQRTPQWGPDLPDNVDHPLTTPCVQGVGEGSTGQCQECALPGLWTRFSSLTISHSMACSRVRKG